MYIMISVIKVIKVQGWILSQNMFNKHNQNLQVIQLFTDIILNSDASKAGRGAHLPHCTTQGLWTRVSNPYQCRLTQGHLHRNQGLRGHGYGQNSPLSM